MALLNNYTVARIARTAVFDIDVGARSPRAIAGVGVVVGRAARATAAPFRHLVRLVGRSLGGAGLGIGSVQAAGWSGDTAPRRGSGFWEARRVL
jgi:hypothetical protein